MISPMKRQKCSGKVCQLTLREWENLILPHMDLDGLIFLRRTCTAFATWETLEKKILTKTIETFGPFSPRHYNKVVVPFEDLIILSAPHAHRLFMIHMHLNNPTSFGIFSNMERLITAFKEKMKILKHIDSCQCVHDDVLIYEFKTGTHTLLVNGLTKAQCDFILNLPAYQPRLERI